MAPQSQDRTPVSATPRDPSLATNYRESGLVHRRILPVPARSGGGRLTERRPAVQPRGRERVKVPHCSHTLLFFGGCRRCCLVPVLLNSRCSDHGANVDVVPTPSCCLTASTSPSTQISVIWQPSVVKNAAPIHSISLPVAGIPKKGPR